MGSFDVSQIYSDIVQNNPTLMTVLTATVSKQKYRGIEVSLNAVAAVLMEFMELIRSWQGMGWRFWEGKTC